MLSSACGAGIRDVSDVHVLVHIEGIGLLGKIVLANCTASFCFLVG